MTEPEVWRQLDFTTGLPSRLTRTRLAVALVAAMVVSLGFVVLWHSGVITPRLDWPRNGYGTSWKEEPGHFEMVFPVENHGWQPLTIVSAGESQPGLELEPPLAGWYPIRVAPGAQAEIRVSYRVSDCAAFAALKSIPVRVQRAWGTQSGRISMAHRWEELTCKTPPDER